LGSIKFQLTDAKDRLYDESNVTHKRSSTTLLPKQTFRIQKTTQNRKADFDDEVGADVLRLRFLKRKIMRVQVKDTRVFDTWPLERMRLETDIPQ